MGGYMKIESKIANIDTLTISIKSIRVSKKQMTLAVFRQLPEINIFTEKGGINPDFNYWGVVRYQIRDMGELWVVLSYAGVLYKACIDWDADDDWRLGFKKKELEAAQKKLDLYYEYKDLIESLDKKDPDYYAQRNIIPKELRDLKSSNGFTDSTLIVKDLKISKNYLSYQRALRDSKSELKKLNQLFIAV